MLLCLIGLSPLMAQRYRHKLNDSNWIAYRTSKVYVGVKGGLGDSFLQYSELHDQQLKLGLSANIAACLEWRFIDRLSIGLDCSYAYRKPRLEFNTTYLVSFSETAVTNVSYTQCVYGIGWDLPITCYFGRPRNRLDTRCRCYAFAGPSLFLVLGGSMQWTRTHLVDGQVVDAYRVPVSASSSCPFDYGVRAGVGLACKQRTRHSFFWLKADLSFYYGIPDTFSDAERKLLVAHFHGLGDVQHEVLGTRHYRQARLSVSLSMPLMQRNKGACHIMD